MNFYHNAAEMEKKLEKVLDAHNLLHTFCTNTYPITLTITQNRTPDAQMAFYATNDCPVSSCDAVLRFVFDLDGVVIHTDERLVITADTLNKIKGMAVNLFHAYIEGYYAERRNPERIRLYGDPDANLPKLPAAEEDEGDFSEFMDEQ